MSNFTFSVYRNPPKLGEHQEDVFREWMEQDGANAVKGGELGGSGRS
jgi:hypothetical protein